MAGGETQPGIVSILHLLRSGQLKHEEVSPDLPIPGISAFINQRGDILQPTDYWKPAVIKGTLNANSEMTFYVRQGDYIARAAVFIGGLLFFLSIYFILFTGRRNGIIFLVYQRIRNLQSSPVKIEKFNKSIDNIASLWDVKIFWRHCSSTIM